MILLISISTPRKLYGYFNERKNLNNRKVKKVYNIIKFSFLNKKIIEIEFNSAFLMT